MSTSVEHLYAQHKVFPFVGVGDEEGFGGAILFAVVEVQLLHVVVRIADADEGAELRGLFTFAFSYHLLLPQSPALAKEVDARRGTEESLFIAVRFLGHLKVNS